MKKKHQLVGVAFLALLLAATARADVQLTGVGILVAGTVQKFDGLRQYGALLKYDVVSSTRSKWMPTRLDLSVGYLERYDSRSSFLSIGPSYLRPIGKNRRRGWFMDFGVHPTFVTESEFDGKELGGNFFFTSHLGFGAFLGERRNTSVVLRYQHESNAGLNSTNPGVDMLALTVSYHFGTDGFRRLAKNSANTEVGVERPSVALP